MSRHGGFHKIAGSSDKVSYYTDLPNKQAFVWVRSVFTRKQRVPSQDLSQVDQALLVWMRLRMDIHLCFLADRLYDIGNNSASKLLETVLTVLVAELKGLAHGVAW